MRVPKQIIAIAVEASVHQVGSIGIDARPEVNHPYSHAAKLLTYRLAAPDTSITGTSNE
jgi:hypothetical protein